MANKCPNCGKTLKESAEYCGKCGSKIKIETPPPAYSLLSVIKQRKKTFIGFASLLLAAILVLVIINPSNSPKSVFNEYLECLRHQDGEKLLQISYEANFSNKTTSEEVLQAYRNRFSAGVENPIKGKTIRITEVKHLTDEEISARKAELSANYRNTARITDICRFTLEITDEDHPRVDEDSYETVDPARAPIIGYAEAICVTGKWYIGDVTGL